jgi:hypothetical protein
VRLSGKCGLVSGNGMNHFHGVRFNLCSHLCERRC